jgi:hypothetical protein
MKTINILLALLFSVLLWGCFAQKQFTSKGDEVELKLHSGRIIKGEILGIADTSIIFSEKGNFTSLFKVRKENIESVTVNGYSNSSWIQPVIMLQVLSPILLAASANAANVDLNPGFFLLFVPAIITTLIFSLTDADPPVWDARKSFEPLDSFKKYTRYPDGLNDMKL